jgi:transcriptional regulator with XRE-family HTH domain
MDAAPHLRLLEGSPATAPTATTPSAPSSRLGERLRSLRLAAGLTQSQLAGERFSKEYVSQIERGKTRPTTEAIGWLAGQLGVDPAFLGSGVSTGLRGRVEALLARAEALSEAHRYVEAAELFASVRRDVGATGSAELETRALSGEAWARLQEGEARQAVELLLVARELAEGPQFSDVERADILFRLGVCRYKLSSIATAVALFDQALAVAEGSGLPCDLLRADILGWRSRCRRRQRDFEAAREDVEAALELARGTDDRRVVANTYFQASLVAERMGQWVASRTYAQQAKALYEELDDERNVGRLMLNLGGLQLLLGGGGPPEGVVRARGRGGVPARRGAGARQPGGRAAAARGLRRRRRERAQGAGAARGAGGLPGRDRPVAARPRAGVARAGAPGRGRGVLPGRGPRVRADVVGRAQGRGVGCTG